jgi:hypothetical protein
MSVMRRKSISTHDITLRRKNFLPSLFVTVFFWVLLGVLVLYTNPEMAVNLFSFFLVLFFAFLFTFSLIFVNSRRGFLMALAITFYMLLRFLGLGGLINLLLLFGIVAAIEFYIKEGRRF